MTDIITMNHGSGGRITHDLISKLFLKYFTHTSLQALTDAAILDNADGSLAFTTDGHVVDPIFFPGGNIGKLSVCGTVNDLSVSGAVPKYLSSSFIIEEGFAMADLETIVKSMAEAANEAGVAIVTGDTKVVQKGKCDKIYIATSGIGFLHHQFAHIAHGLQVKTGYKIITNGTLGDHSVAILASRESLTFETPVVSDCAALNSLIQQILAICPDVAFMRDATRGGMATVACELASKIQKGIILYEKDIPVNDSVMAICEIFGFDPLFLANEGKVMMVVPSEQAQHVVDSMKKHPLGKNASVIGEIIDDRPGKVVLQTITGGRRMLDIPAGVQLPRIC